MWIRTEEEVDALLNEMLTKNNGKYITQGVAFNKSSESQMQLLKLALMSSYSFGGMIKELLNEKFSESLPNNSKQSKIISNPPQNNFKDFESTSTNASDTLKEFEIIPNNENKKLGNFL